MRPSMPMAGGGDGISIRRVVLELLAAKKTANRRAVYIKSLKHYLNRFAAGREESAIENFTAADVEVWLSQFPGDYSRHTWLNRISTLFSFAIRRGYVEKNPCARVERVTVDKKAPVILSVAQAEKLLTDCPPPCLAWLVLALFAGIRPEGELMRVAWEDVNLDTGTVRIQFPKVRKHKRIVPLEPVAVAWLRPLVGNGAVCPSASTLRRWRRKMREVLGVSEWPQDVLRHTAASFLLAKYADAGKVANWLGNSPGILLTHYHEPVSAADALLFWDLKPERVGRGGVRERVESADAKNIASAHSGGASAVGDRGEVKAVAVQPVERRAAHGVP
jgi:integrase